MSKTPNVCDRCFAAFVKNGDPIAIVNKDKVQYFTLCFSPFKYGDMVTKFIMELKYNCNGKVAQTAAPFIVSAIGNAIPNLRGTILIPVPLYKSRHRKRGYNQATVIANEIARLTGCRVDDTLLERTRATTPQKKMNVGEREQNIIGSIRVTDKTRAQDKNFLVIDDVFTTGTTINECAKVLMAGGAARVDAATIARA